MKFLMVNGIKHNATTPCIIVSCYCTVVSNVCHIGLGADPVSIQVRIASFCILSSELSCWILTKLP